jgi:hypothetical protein
MIRQSRNTLCQQLLRRVIRRHCSYHPRMTAPAATLMSNSLYPPEGPQSIGQVLDAGFGIFKVSLVRCLLFGAMAMIAGQLPNIYSLATGQPFDSYLHGEPVSIVLAALGSIITVYLSAVMLLRQREIAQGRRRSTREELAYAARRLPPLLGVVAVALVLLAIIPVTVLLLSRAGILTQANPTFLAIGLAIVGLPVLWLVPGLSMAVASAILTKNGFADSLRAGIALAYGSWWRTMLTYAVWAVLLAVFNFVAVIVIIMALPLIGATDVATVTAGTPVVFVALRAVGLPFLVAIMLAVHGELQVRKQGADLERRLAGVAQA